MGAHGDGGAWGRTAEEQEANREGRCGFHGEDKDEEKEKKLKMGEKDQWASGYTEGGYEAPW